MRGAEWKRALPAVREAEWLSAQPTVCEAEWLSALLASLNSLHWGLGKIPLGQTLQ